MPYITPKKCLQVSFCTPTSVRTSNLRLWKYAPIGRVRTLTARLRQDTIINRPVGGALRLAWYRGNAPTTGRSRAQLKNLEVGCSIEEETGFVCLSFCFGVPRFCNFVSVFGTSSEFWQSARNFEFGKALWRRIISYSGITIKVRVLESANVVLRPTTGTQKLRIRNLAEYLNKNITTMERWRWTWPAAAIMQRSHLQIFYSTSKISSYPVCFFENVHDFEYRFNFCARSLLLSSLPRLEKILPL